ncbi:DUF4241 domain-containing protein [Streptomyces sp. NPDC020858]|uniref:DUF4241 domain-containing protein n=1 Tax=Streptomyces sp. NPDC020858 TaxID=3365097 RepID=UPI003795E6DD
MVRAVRLPPRGGGDDPLTFAEVVEVEEVTTIRAPSGRLIVDSPWSEDPGREIMARIPPGTYRVEAAWTEARYEHGGESFEGRECAATRLLVSDDPVVVWEAGAGVNDDIGDADVVAGGPHSAVRCCTLRRCGRPCPRTAVAALYPHVGDALTDSGDEEFVWAGIAGLHMRPAPLPPGRGTGRRRVPFIADGMKPSAGT